MHTRHIAVIGLGYVGLPVAVAFGQHSKTIGFDINQTRLAQLRAGLDVTNEVSEEVLKAANILFTDDITVLAQANFYIVAVPTPVNAANQPDLTPIARASQTVAQVLKAGDIVVYESTVYPGVTEEYCLPLLEQYSKLIGGIDFTVGYSPERINPGDKEHTFTQITKVVSGQNPQTLAIIAQVYGAVVKAGVYCATSIKVAEAAKVIENTQRDLNIALMNELAIIFNRLNIDTHSVLAAAGTKWNFLAFKPGLVGGHCIGVDPYYLTYKAQLLGYHPQVILAGRHINDGMGAYIATQTIKTLCQTGHDISQCCVTVLGLTFKENCPDLRNSKVIDVLTELKTYAIDVQVCDEQADTDQALHEYGIQLIPLTQLKPANAIIIAVAHDDFARLSIATYLTLLKNKPVIIDVKGICDLEAFQSAGIHLWRL